MSDDLVKRLRDTPNWMREGFQDWKDNMRTYDRAPFEAADRIEELEAENRLFRDAVYIDDLTVTMQADDRSKAMVAMKRALDFLNADMPTEAKTALRTTLAELTGGKDE